MFKINEDNTVTRNYCWNIDTIIALKASGDVDEFIYTCSLEDGDTYEMLKEDLVELINNIN